MLVFLGWFGGLATLHLILPGKKVQGTPLPDGTRLTYKLNGEWVSKMHVNEFVQRCSCQCVCKL